LIEILANILILTSVSAWCAFGFTGSTPFTSLSGVRKELKIALPATAGMFLAGSLLWGWALLAAL
jgi:acetyl-CoA decarbonylase/synthase complex subunit gamma